ncbi:MAG: hypothetical protein LBR58_07110 [Propionibacteriaceae bacterium]|jgi:hypothetical protein|nr:hypothetical protein [Propionibacteriaceae bacterium]
MSTTKSADDSHIDTCAALDSSTSETQFRAPSSDLPKRTWRATSRRWRSASESRQHRIVQRQESATAVVGDLLRESGLAALPNPLNLDNPEVVEHLVNHGRKMPVDE